MERCFSRNDLKKLIIPLIFEQTLAVTVGMADTMMVSSAGDAAVSGVSLVDMINNLIFNVLAAIATGGAVVTSQYMGAHRPDKARESARQLVITVVAAGLGVAALAILLRKPLLQLLFGRIEKDVMKNALIYLVITALSFPFLAVYNGCAALFRSMGNAKVTLKVSVVINLINISGNAVCIFLLKMGAAGVAVPSLVSRAVGAVLLFRRLRRTDQPIYIEPGPFRWNGDMSRRILRIGIPGGVESGIFQLGRVIVVSIISGFGTPQIAANGVANNLDGVGILIGQAMNLAMITVIGQCVGAGDESQVRYYTKRLLAFTYIVQGAVILTVMVSRGQVLRLYDLSKEATDLAKDLILIHNIAALILWPVAFVLPNMLRACNDVRFPMVVSVSSMFIFRVGLSYILGVRMGMGALGVWYAMVVDWVCRTAFFVGRYFSNRCRHFAGLDKNST